MLIQFYVIKDLHCKKWIERSLLSESIMSMLSQNSLNTSFYLGLIYRLV